MCRTPLTLLQETLHRSQSERAPLCRGGVALVHVEVAAPDDYVDNHDFR